MTGGEFWASSPKCSGLQDAPGTQDFSTTSQIEGTYIRNGLVDGERLEVIGRQPPLAPDFQKLCKRLVPGVGSLS